MRIAGGLFGFKACLDAVPAAEPQFIHEPKLLFLGACCGIKFLIDTLRSAQVWMPSYLCYSMIDAVDPQVTELRFFEIGYDLEVTSLDWLDVLIPGSLVVLIDYFGFPCNDHVAKEAKARGAFILENASQTFLSTHVGRRSDFLLFSPRKTPGVPDGGILRYLRDGALPPAYLISPPQEWWLKALEARIARREFDRYGGIWRWFDLFRQLEAAYPLGPYRMSELSEMLLESAFDYPAIAQARRANYAYLAESFAEHALINRLYENTVPLGFPIRLKKRDEVRQFLFDHGVYPPVHWQIIECVPTQFVESPRLSAHIMTIPCNQRLSRDDVIRTSDLLHRALGTQ